MLRNYVMMTSTERLVHSIGAYKLFVQHLRKDTSFARKCSMYVSGVCMVRRRMKFTENQEVKAIFRNNTTIDNDVVAQVAQL